MRIIAFGAALALTASMAVADAKQDVINSLHAFNDLFNEFTVSKNVDGLVSLYTEDALWIEQNKPLAQGQEAVRSTFAFLASKNAVNDHSIDKLVVSDDGSLAVMVGTAIVKVAEFNLDTTGTFLFVMKPEGDSWKIVSDMWHQHTPAEQ